MIHFSRSFDFKKYGVHFGDEGNVTPAGKVLNNGSIILQRNSNFKEGISGDSLGSLAGTLHTVWAMLL